jgi:predicted patatin/cPLA2 family phospholipase
MLIIIITIAYIINKVYKIKKKYRIPQCDADIILAPGGIKGSYTIGICNYIKNHFDITNKKIVGFSAGSINNLYMNIIREKDVHFLRTLIQIKLNNNIKKFLKNIIDSIDREFTDKDFNFNHIHTGVCHSDGMTIYNKFLNLKDALDCCVSSSFIPFITSKDIFCFYKYKLCLDGGVCYHEYKEKRRENTLVINHYMFKRYKKPKIRFHGMTTKNVNPYQMYLYGYHDARKNHDYFLKYLKPKDKIPKDKIPQDKTKNN